MKLYVKDGHVLCGYAENGKTFKENYRLANDGMVHKDKDFLSECSHSCGECFIGFYGNALKLDKTGNPIYDYNLLHDVIAIAEDYGVQVEDEVYDALNDYETAARAEQDKINEEREASRLAEERRRRWESVKCNGCIDCANCRMVGDDDYVCRETGDDLPIKNCPGYVGVTYYLFNYKPFPTDSCPLKI